MKELKKYPNSLNQNKDPIEEAFMHGDFVDILVAIINKPVEVKQWHTGIKKQKSVRFQRTK
jgi:hypothetical protein